MRSKQYFTSIKNNPHEISTDPIFNKKIFFQVFNDQKEDFSTNIRNAQLFLTDKNIYRSTRKFPTFAYLIFKETLVWFFHILR